MILKKPENRNLLKYKWIFAIKPDEKGNNVRCKARLVAKGFQQQCGIGYWRVAKLSTIRTGQQLESQNEKQMKKNEKKVYIVT